ncbi:MAG: hypothetical protein V4541_00930 [Bacteroidota bacterium]
MKKPTKEQIEATANAIVHHFIPKNPEEKTLSFNFTIPPASNFNVVYEKDKQQNWILAGYKSVDKND